MSKEEKNINVKLSSNKLKRRCNSCGKRMTAESNIEGLLSAYVCECGYKINISKGYVMCSYCESTIKKTLASIWKNGFLCHNCDGLKSEVEKEIAQKLIQWFDYCLNGQAEMVFKSDELDYIKIRKEAIKDFIKKELSKK